MGLRAKVLAQKVGGAHTGLCERARRAHERLGGGARRADFQTDVGEKIVEARTREKIGSR